MIDSSTASFVRQPILRASSEFCAIAFLQLVALSQPHVVLQDKAPFRRQWQASGSFDSKRRAIHFLRISEQKKYVTLAATQHATTPATMSTTTRNNI
jgi:hypothetical protein